MTDTNVEGNTNSLPPNLPISLIPFEVQLKNVVPVEIVAKRFPVDIAPEKSRISTAHPPRVEKSNGVVVWRH
ncbi:MAG TPA: hypothetical protein VN207_10210 [Ktedonobacteraceae bacterium]|nr:hypothetical protein [Ktedonobacteraceae bacterium]